MQESKQIESNRQKIIAAVDALIQRGEAVPNDRGEIAAIAKLKPIDVSYAFRSRTDLLKAVARPQSTHRD